MSKPMTVTCTTDDCGTTANLPDDRDHSGLWDAGWRWIGLGCISCPACPPVIVVDDQGRHHAGPGDYLASTASAPLG
jgi:hypothetical protein